VVKKWSTKYITSFFNIIGRNIILYIYIYIIGKKSLKTGAKASSAQNTKKEDLIEYHNYRRISLVNTAYKVLPSNLREFHRKQKKF
jgi:hypothetical protein